MRAALAVGRGAANRFGDDSTQNDIAVLWPPSRAPTIVAAYLTGVQARAAERRRAIADVARIVTSALY